MKRLLRYALTVAAMGALLIRPAAADKLRVVATFSVIADMVSNVAGDQVDLITVVGPDGDCEGTNRPQAMCRSWPVPGILFMNGLNDESSRGYRR